MSVSSRTRNILELLLRSERDLTASEIATEIHVSSRTVHRELAAVADVLREQGIELLRKSGTGIRVQGDKASLENLHRLVSTSNDIEFSLDERQSYILCLLLRNDEPVKLFTLAHELKVTVPTITNDLDELTDWVQKFDVELVRKRGYGVELVGKEERLREVIRQLVKLRIDDAELIATRDERSLHPLDRELFILTGKSEMANIENILWNWEADWADRMSENSYTDLLIRLSITLQRIRAERMVTSLIATDQTVNLVMQDVLGAQRLTEQLSEGLGISICPAELAYILSLLEQTRQEDNVPFLGEDIILAQMVSELIQQVQHAMEVDYSGDISLPDGLFHHMKVSLQRIYDGLSIRNPLLDQIQKDYIELYGVIRKAVNLVVLNLHVPDEEIGFLVMHFGASQERIKQLRREVRAILVCTSGIGSSKHLQIRLQKELPQIEIIDRVSWYEASRISEETYDLIISTVDLPLDPLQYIKISPLLTLVEVDRLRSFIKGTTLGTQRGGAMIEAVTPTKFGFEQLLSLKTTLDEIVLLVKRFKVVEIREPHVCDLNTLLDEACLIEQEEGVLITSSLVVERLMERERSSSQMIPGTSLALFHTRSSQILRPSLSLYRLVQPFPMKTNPPTQLSQFLLMLAPQTLSRESLEVLSEISAMLLESTVIELLETGDEIAIRSYLTVRLRTFLSTKIEKRVRLK